MPHVGPPSDDRLPAYVRLRDALASRIVSVEWGPDQPIPSEARLSKEYGVSVGTVRKAVDGLVAEGLLERRQGSGTYLRRPSFDVTLFRFFSLHGGDGAQPSIPSSKLILRAPVEAPPEVRAALGTSDVIRIVRVRSLADQPILFETIYIPAARFAGFEGLGDAQMGPLLYPLYFEHFGVLVTRATDDLSFGVAEAETARHLNIAPGDPVAIIRRTAFDPEGGPVEWRIAKGSAARFHYRSDIN
jgi:GntR family transcriptional regulator